MAQSSRLHHGCFEKLKGDDYQEDLDMFTPPSHSNQESSPNECELSNLNVTENMASELIGQYDNHKNHAHQSPSRSRYSPTMTELSMNNSTLRRPNNRRYMSSQALNCNFGNGSTVSNTIRRRNVMQPSWNSNCNNTTIARNPHIQNILKQRAASLRHKQRPDKFVSTKGLDTHHETVDYSTNALTIGRMKNHLKSAIDINSTLRPLPAPRSVKNFADTVNTLRKQKTSGGMYMPPPSELGFSEIGTLNYTDSNGLMKVIRNVEQAMESCLSTDEKYQTSSLQFLAHCTYKCKEIKEYMRTSGAIPKLILLLDHPNENVRHYTLHTLRNLSYGSRVNKVEFMTNDGLSKVSAIITNEDCLETRLTALKLLWNLSATPELHKEIIRTILPLLTKKVIEPIVNDYKNDPNNDGTNSGVYLSAAVGIIANIDLSEKDEERDALLGVEGLLECLISLVRFKVQMLDVSDETVRRALSIICMIVRNYMTTTEWNGLAQGNTNEKVKPKGGLNLFFKGQKKNKEKVEEVYNVVDENNPASLLFSNENQNLFCDLFQSEHKDPEMFLKSATLISICTSGPTKMAQQMRKLVASTDVFRVLKYMLGSEDHESFLIGVRITRNLAREKLCVDQMDLQFAKKLTDHLPALGEEKQFVDEKTLRMILITLKTLLESKPQLICDLEKCKTVKKIIDIKECKFIHAYGKGVTLLANSVLVSMWSNKKVKKALKKRGYKKKQFKWEQRC